MVVQILFQSLKYIYRINKNIYFYFTKEIIYQTTMYITICVPDCPFFFTNLFILIHLVSNI